MRKSILVIALFACAGLAASGAYAQGSGPRYVSSEPGSGEFVHQAPARVSITFSEPLGGESTMGVTDECSRRADAGDIAIDDNQMSVALATNSRGTYTVTYSATGTEEGGSATPGSFTFRVHLGPSCDGSGGGDDGDHGHHGGEDPGQKGNDQGSQNHQDHKRNGSGGGHRTHPGDGEHTPAHALLAHQTTDNHEADGHMADGHRKDPGKGKRHQHRGRDTEPPKQKDEPRSARARGANPARSTGPETTTASGGDLLVALALAAGFGAGGGLLLRFSPFD
jgi:methionine-rich copper-binding protein CopC